MSSFFPISNVYPTDEAWASWVTLFSLFLLWWLVVLLAGLFGGLLKRRRRAVAPVAAAPGDEVVAAPVVAATTPGPYDSKLKRAASALRDVFISALAAVILNQSTNGISRPFNILLWIVVILGAIWAFFLLFAARISNLLLFSSTCFNNEALLS